MRSWTTMGIASGIALVGMLILRAGSQPAVLKVDEQVLREYSGVYRVTPDRYVYLQVWNEFSGFDHPGQLVAFDENGEIRVLYPTDRDRFFTGPGAAVSTEVESRIEFTRDAGGRIASFAWHRGGDPPWTGQRVETERGENVRFPSGDIRLAGTLLRPATGATHPAIILVHGSGPQDRQFVLPFARFLVRHGIVVFGYDKRGVGQSSGDWESASFQDLADDVVAAFHYLKTRAHVDPKQIGLLGISQAGWIMPLAAARAKELAFVVSLSGAGVTPAETTIDQAQNEMTARGMKPETVAAIVSIMKLQYRFARTGEGWDEYAAARRKLAAQIGQPPETMPGAPDHPYWKTIRASYFYDPVPPLRQLQVPVLALFGELDTNIVADKNRAAWERALNAGGHRDYTLRILPRGNHYLWEARVGTTAEMATVQRFVPEYFSTVRDWLAKRVLLRGAR